MDFNNVDDNNNKLAFGIIENQTPGFYVFSAPWETISELLKMINTQYGYDLNPPSGFMGSNYVYAISIPSSGKATLETYNSGLNPPDSYPVLPTPVNSAACSHSLQPLVLTGGVDGVIIPSGINTNSGPFAKEPVAMKKSVPFRKILNNMISWVERLISDSEVANKVVPGL